MMKLKTLNSRNRHAGKKEVVSLKLDLGSGPNGKPGFTHVDSIAFPGVDVVCDLVRRIRVVAEVIDGKPYSLPVGSYVPWPWDNDSVEEAHASHFLEHLDAMQRVHFFNELYRVLKPGAKTLVITPHWSSCRAYGDPTHKWPPVSEFSWYYLSKAWRFANAPHTDAIPGGVENRSGVVKTLEILTNPNGFKCNFEVQWGYSLEPGVGSRNQEYQQFAMQYYKEACQDMIATLTKA